MMFQKLKTYRSKAYLKFVRGLLCCVSGKKGVQAHHLEGGGTALKGDDLSCIPLTPELHQELHQIGRKTFEEKYNVDLARANVEALRAYIRHLEAGKE